MHFARSNCGHLKAKWDNHPSCLSCTSCTRISPCSISSSWTDKVWSLTEKRRLYATRKSVMTKRRKLKKSKKTKKSQLDLSDSGTFDGSTAPQSYTARGWTHQGGSPGDLVQPGMKSTSHQSTGHPVTGQPVTSQTVTSQPGISFKSFAYDYKLNCLLVTYLSMCLYKIMLLPVTSHRSPVNQSPGNLSLVIHSLVIQSPVNR